MDFLKQVWSRDFLFFINRVQLEQVDRIFGVLALAFILIALLVFLTRLLTKNPLKKNLLTRKFNVFLVTGVLGVLWYGARFENVNVLGTHFVFLLILLILIIWLGYIVKYYFTKYRKDLVVYEKEMQKRKYLQ